MMTRAPMPYPTSVTGLLPCTRPESACMPRRDRGDHQKFWIKIIRKKVEVEGRKMRRRRAMRLLFGWLCNNKRQ